MVDRPIDAAIEAEVRTSRSLPKGCGGADRKVVRQRARKTNSGEGGTLALMALAQRALGRHAGALVLCGIISAALFYGDAMITPALSVLSAIEGLKVVTPAFDGYIVALTVVILVVLFAVQSRGTAKVAAFFGPVMVIWF